MPTLRRWVPLISVLVLVVVAFLRALGYADAAEAINNLSRAIFQVDTETAMAAGAAAGLVMKIVSLVRGAGSTSDQYVRPGPR